MFRNHRSKRNHHVGKNRHPALSLSHTNFNMSDLETEVRNAVKRGYSDIRLIGMNITDEVLSAISEIWMNCKTITSIDLSGNKITTLKNIVFPPCVERLFLGYNSITALDGFVIPNGLCLLQLVFCIFLY